MNGKNVARSLSGCVKGVMGRLNAVHVFCLFFSFIDNFSIVYCRCVHIRVQFNSPTV